MSPHQREQSALIIGVGLIGGSVGLRLREAGWRVVGRDRSPECLERALAVGAIDSVAPDGFVAGIDLTFVATPVGAIADEVALALQDTEGLVTDVGSVKTPLLSLMSNPRFIGGHPMAGSEQEGVEGARVDLFEGRTWVLTPVD
ncbi:MAG: prephenate dehydrogenase/arogenate dehydrogenase family protein, partial [Actinobacteria bacterium]|nr:prephenate dehydrogenase/arogenate dehydrogenase family protein [Actinomycetota bacterium]